MFAAVDLGMADDRQRAGHEQTAQVAVTLLADAAEPFPTPARMLLRYQPDPGREIPPRSESLRISDAGDQGGWLIASPSMKTSVPSLLSMNSTKSLAALGWGAPLITAAWLPSITWPSL